jgi:PBP1b-binding outer membrane lipoprotein LpoB
MKTRTILMFLLSAIILTSCSVTQPRLNYSGGNYNSVSDDIIINNSTQEAVIKLTNSIDPNDKILLVQVVNDPKNDLLADRIFEELYKRGYIVALAKNEELKTMDTDHFDKFLMFYPTVYGTESAETSPTFWPKALIYVPIVGWIIGPRVISAYSYVDRQAGVSIHCRMVNAETGEIEWIKDFSGQDKVRLEGGSFHEILFPQM